MINIVVTSKPVDGLFYYSYEYCDMLNKAGYSAQVVVITHRNFTKEDYLDSISNKYIHCQNIIIDDYVPALNDITLIMGRSMMTLSWQSFNDYTDVQKRILYRLFDGDIISVYSENHIEGYPKAVDFYKPKQIVDLCDTEVYPNGVGTHFEKTINFSIYKPYKDNIQFKHLFLGTNPEYYAYVYTKETFDPAPRIFQECKYYEKDVVYLRDKNIQDGGSVYWRRDCKEPDVTPIVKVVEEFNEN